jgi:hypothetical protein
MTELDMIQCRFLKEVLAFYRKNSTIAWFFDFDNDILYLCVVFVSIPFRQPVDCLETINGGYTTYPPKHNF